MGKKCNEMFNSNRKQHWRWTNRLRVEVTKEQGWGYSTLLYFIEFATVTQHGDRGWNRNNLPTDTYTFILHPAHECMVVPHHRGLCPLLFRNSSVGSFTSHKNQNSERAVSFRPYPRRLKYLTICRCYNKGSQSPKLFQDPECWSGRGLNPRAPAQLTGACPIELTGRRLMTNSHELSRLSLDLWVVLVVVVVVVVATTCMRITRQFNREDERGQRWFNKYSNRSAPDWLYKNLLRTIRIKTYICLWNWLRTKSCSGALPLIFF